MLDFLHCLNLEYHDTLKWMNVGLVTSAKTLQYYYNMGENSGEMGRKQGKVEKVIHRPTKPYHGK